MSKLNIVFGSFPDYSSNAKALYEYMKNRYKDNMNLIWVVNSDEMLNKLKSSKIEVYKLGTQEYFEKMKEVDVFFTTHANITGEKNSHALYIELWHGIGPKHSGYLSDKMSESDISWYGDIRKKIDYIIVPSDFWRPIFATVFNIEYSRVLPLGYPKLDYFVNANAKENLEKVLKLNVKKYDKVIYYMPTFRKGCNRKQESSINLSNIFNIYEYDENTVLKYLEKNNYLLCIKKHPSEEIDLNFKENNNIKVLKDGDLLENKITINEILNAADLMITDYSSLGTEFVFLNKPVIYINKDIEEYKKNRGIIFSDIDFWMSGYKVNNIFNLLKAIDDSFNPKCEYISKLTDMKKLWFGNLKDGGCKNICDFIFKNNQISSSVKYYKDIEDILNEEIEEQKEKLREKDSIIDARNARIRELDEFISNIINSKGWQTLERLRNIKKKILKK